MGKNAVQYSFSGHETFPFRYPWLKKGFDAVLEDPSVFQRDEAITILGVGKNMVRSIRHWCLTAEVLAESPEGGGVLRPTPTIGKGLGGKPYCFPACCGHARQASSDRRSPRTAG